MKKITLSLSESNNFSELLGIDESIGAFFYRHPTIFGHLLKEIFDKASKIEDKEKKEAVLEYLRAIAAKISYLAMRYSEYNHGLAVFPMVKDSAIKRENLRKDSPGSICVTVTDEFPVYRGEISESDNDICFKGFYSPFSYGRVERFMSTVDYFFDELDLESQVKVSASQSYQFISDWQNLRGLQQYDVNYRPADIKLISVTRNMFLKVFDFLNNDMSENAYKELKKANNEFFPPPPTPKPIPQHWIVAKIIIKAVIKVVATVLLIALSCTIIFALCGMAGLWSMYDKTPQEKACAALEKLNPNPKIQSESLETNRPLGLSIKSLQPV